MTNSLIAFQQFTQPAPQSGDLLEAWGDPVYESPLWANDSSTTLGSSFSRLARPATTLYDRSDGRFLPVYQTEFDLAVIRATGRLLAQVSPNLVGAVRNMCNYTIAEGFTFTASRDDTAPITGEQAEPLVKLVQREINTCLDDIGFVGSFDREIHNSSIEDGEVLLQIKQGAGGKVRVYRQEPDQLRQPMATRQLEDWIQATYGIPCDEFVSSWSFGVHTRADQPDEPLGFHIVTDESGSDWEYVPACRMVHIKRNVPRNAKRGFSDFYPIEPDSLRGEKLRRNMAEGAAVQSAIAFVRQHVQGVTATGARTMVGGNSTATSGGTTSGGLSKVKYGPATIVDLAAGLEYKPGPMGSDRANDFMVVANYVQRTQAVRWSMPEYMFSGDASNANYSSTLVAESPFVKSCEAEQRFYSRHFVDMLWKVLRLRFELGAFAAFGLTWEQIEQVIQIKAQCPTVATRDPLARAQAAEIEIRSGTLSPKTACEEAGHDYEAEQANGLVSSATSTAPVSTVATTNIAAGAVPIADVAASAMNGAQVASILDLIAQVSAGTIPAESAIQAIPIAFPTVSVEQARAMIQPAAAMLANTGPMDPDGNPLPAQQGGGELVGMKLRDATNLDKLRNRYLDDFRSGKADENTTRLSLDSLGYSKAKIDLYLDADPANDPPADGTVTESVDPDSPVPKLPTREEVTAQAAAAIRDLIEDLRDAVANDDKAKQKSISKQIDDVQRAAGIAASVLGWIDPYKEAADANP